MCGLQRYLTGSVIAVAMFLIVATLHFGLSNQQVEAAKNGDFSSVDVEVLYSGKRSYSNIDDFAKYADTIVVGTIIEEAPYNGTGSRYVLSVEEVLKGEAKSKISVYDEKGLIAVGKKHLVFLESSESSLYGDIMYSRIHTDSIFEFEMGQVSRGRLDKLKGLKSEKEIIESLKKSDAIKQGKKKEYKVKDEAKDFDELVALSDGIAHIVPNEVTVFNENVAASRVKVLRSYKGSLTDGALVYLPSNAKAGIEYIVFLSTLDGGAYAPTVRHGCIISKEDKEDWEDALKRIEMLGKVPHLP